MTDCRRAVLLLALALLGAARASVREARWLEPEHVGNGTLPCVYISRDGALLHVVYVEPTAAGTVTLVHRTRPALTGTWGAPTPIATFAEAESADIIGFDTFVSSLHRDTFPPNTSSRPSFARKKHKKHRRSMSVAVSARRAGDRRLEVYYVESTDSGASWSAPMRMLHAADDCARTSVNVVQDAGSVWVGALKACAGSGATAAAVWYRERGDRFTVETQVAGVARQLGLTLAVTTVVDRRLMFLSSSAVRTAAGTTGYFDVVYRQEVERPFGNTWLWQKEPECSATRPIVIAKGFAILPPPLLLCFCFCFCFALTHTHMHTLAHTQKLLCDAVH